MVGGNIPYYAYVTLMFLACIYFTKITNLDFNINYSNGYFLLPYIKYHNRQEEMMCLT